MEFPTSYEVLSSLFSVFNFNFSTSSIVTCSSDSSYDYSMRLKIDTVYPLVFLLLLFLANRIQIYYKKYITTECIESINVNAKYCSIAIVFTSLILPGISGNIFF
jgi:uncharacterized membrane protein